MNYYPAAPKGEEDWNGFGMHADLDFLTVVAHDSAPGLQIMLPNGDWVPVRKLRKLALGASWS